MVIDSEDKPTRVGYRKDEERPQHPGLAAHR